MRRKKQGGGCEEEGYLMRSPAELHHVWKPWHVVLELDAVEAIFECYEPGVTDDGRWVDGERQN